jgi:hypothetical protein
LVSHSTASALSSFTEISLPFILFIFDHCCPVKI